MCANMDGYLNSWIGCLSLFKLKVYLTDSTVWNIGDAGGFITNKFLNCELILD